VRGSRRRRAAHVIRQQGQELDNVEWKEVKNRDGPDPRSTNLRLCRRAGRSGAASMNGYWANSLDRSPGCTGNSKTRWAVRRQVPTPSEDLGLLEGGTSRTHGTDCGKEPVTRAPRDLGMRRPNAVGIVTGADVSRRAELMPRFRLPKAGWRRKRTTASAASAR